MPERIRLTKAVERVEDSLNILDISWSRVTGLLEGRQELYVREVVRYRRFKKCGGA